MNYFYLCILQCSDGSYYVGHTDDIEKRISEHQSGKAHGYTSKRLPVKVAFTELFEDREVAKVAERQIKKWNRKKKEALINGNFEELVKISNMKKINT
jgi:predicted GIY-YIG superfamily endonuclease